MGKLQISVTERNYVQKQRYPTNLFCYLIYFSKLLEVCGIETWFIFYILTIGVLVYKTIFVQLNYIYFHNKK